MEVPVKTTSQTVTELAAAIPAASSELQSALSVLETKPKESLSNSRLILETVLKQLAAYEGLGGKGKTAGQLLGDKKIEKLVEPYVHASMRFVNSVASAYGDVHKDREPSSEMSSTVFRFLLKSVEWYAVQYLGLNLLDNFGASIEPCNKIVLYVSTGGTDRCAMANLITRHYLKDLDAARSIQTMSVSFGAPTAATMSKLAVQVVAEKLGIKELPEHHSIHGDDRYWHRAHLVLAMDGVKLRNRLPSQKTHLFTEFYGGNGGVNDPLDENTPEAYLKVFTLIHELIRPGVKPLVQYLSRL
jgi:protein-tyrosine-phosphatase